jgi:membrane protein DedA with SNARE-associated domain/rhodanese-related sulfurtransferase
MSGATQLTYSGIGLAVFAQQLCLPVPAVLLLVTVGALAADGRGNLDVSLVLLASVLGCVLADSVWFWLGRRWGSTVIRIVCSLTSDPRRSRERSGRIFTRWGLRLLLVAKFVPGLDGVSPPLAGAEGATISGFLLYDAAGSLLWTAVYVLLGYGFSGQLDRVMHVIDRFGMMMAVVLGVPLLVYVVWRGVFLVRVIRHLRLRRISPALLQEKMDTNEKVAVFDLLDYEAREGEVAGIPGSVRVDPTRMRKSPRFVIPEGVSIVLYCTSRGELASARVAEHLRKRGFTEVWVLDGGLEAWTQEGRPVTVNLKTPEEVAARLGIELPAGA